MSKRLEYIDAMRGFTMCMVVFQHIALFNGGGILSPSGEVLRDIFISFRMPLFFFISGFIAYKSSEFWTSSSYRQRIATKARVQLLPTVFFYMLYALCFGTNPLQFFEKGFQIYWFTFVLFEIFLIYFTCSFLLRKHSHVLDIVLILLAITFVLMQKLSFTYSHYGQVMSMLNLSSYLQFFVLGHFANKYSTQAFKLIRNNYINALVILFFVAAMIAMTKFGLFADNLVAEWALKYELLRYAGLFIVLSFFYKHRNYFEAGGRVSRAMQYIGRRTLDIYMLHYFFVLYSKNPSLPLVQAITSSDSIVVQIAGLGVMTLLIVGLCLLVSEVLRNSNLLAYCLFGAKRVRE